MSKINKMIGFSGLVLAMFMGALDATIVNIALPDIMKSFNSGLTETTWVATIYVLSMAVFMITAAKIADICGRKLIILIGVLLFGAFSFACMTASSLNLLISFRFIQGIGGAILTPIVLPMGIELFGKENTSKVSAIIGVFSALAAAGGPALGGVILNWASWRWIFGINVPISLVAFLAIIIGTQESYDHSISKKIDWLGMAFLIVTMGSLTFGLLEGHQYGWTSTIIISCFVTFFIGLALFIITEHFVGSPIVPLNLFRETTFTASSVAYLVFGFTIIGPSLILNYFLQNVRNYSALHSAYLIIPASLAISISMPLATKMYQKISARLLIGIGLVVSAGGLFMLSLLRTNTPAANIVACNLIIGIGLGFTAMSYTSSVKFLPVIKNGIGSGIVNAARYVGQCLGMAILVTLLNTNVTNAKRNVRHTAYREINTAVLSPNVKKTAHNEVKKVFKSNTNNNTKISDQQREMKQQIKNAAKKTSHLPNPKTGSTLKTIYTATKKIHSGSNKLNQDYASVINKSQQLLSGKPSLILKGASQKLNLASYKINYAQEKLITGIRLIAQKEQLTKVLKHIKNSKNHQLSLAFDNVFIVNSLVVLLCTPLAYWTDKKEN